MTHGRPKRGELGPNFRGCPLIPNQGVACKQLLYNGLHLPVCQRCARSGATTR